MYLRIQFGKGVNVLLVWAEYLGEGNTRQNTRTCVFYGGMRNWEIKMRVHGAGLEVSYLLLCDSGMIAFAFFGLGIRRNNLEHLNLFVLSMHTQ